MTFALQETTTQTIVTESFTRAPTITFVSSENGEQFISVNLSRVKTIDGVVSEETHINTITMRPEDLHGTGLINPLTAEPIIVDDEQLKLDANQVMVVLYTIFKKAIELNSQVY